MYQIIIYSLSIHRSDKFYVTRGSDQKTTPKQPSLNALTYQAYKRPHNLDKSSVNVPPEVRMSCTVHIMKFLYELGFPMASDY